MTQKHFREWMDERGWSVRRLASALDGMAPSSVQNYRDGSRVPDVVLAEAIARRLGVPLGEITWGRVDLRADLLARMEAAGGPVGEEELLDGMDAGDRKAAQLELSRLSLLCDAGEVAGGWVAIE